MLGTVSNTTTTYHSPTIRSPELSVRILGPKVHDLHLELLLITAMAPKYLTGDSPAINEFIDRFDVRHLPSTLASSDDDIVIE